MGESVRVSSWDELHNALFADSWRANIGRFRSPYVFRGLSQADYPLQTTLMRLHGPYEQLERHILRNFRKYARLPENQSQSFWHLLTLAQHHGLPTRLLDWTYSPLVAMHFATVNYRRFHQDGAVWMVDYEQVHRRLPEPLGSVLQEEGAQAFTVELLEGLQARPCEAQAPEGESSFQRVARTLERFTRLGRQRNFLLFFEPPSLDDRIVNQYALFSVMPRPAQPVDAWLGANPDLYRKVIIPAELKWEIRDKLDQCNITERVLFPGLDGLSVWLRRHYSPRARRADEFPLA